MRVLRTVALAALLVATACAMAHADTIFPGATARPNNKGDQLIFYYDVRDGFTTFLNLRNEAASPLQVQLAFYGPDFGKPFTEMVTIPAVPGKNGSPGTGGLVVVDVGGLKANGLPATPGVAFATTVDDANHPIVTRGLVGNFTVANTAIGSAWGSPAAARSAIHPPTPGATACSPKAPGPKIGDLIDGSTVLLEPIQPATADLAAYYDPATLAPATAGGNQLIFISFVDVSGPTFAAAAAETKWTFGGVRNSGEGIAPATLSTSGVMVSDLVSVAGPGIAGASGGLTFTAPASAAPLTRLIFFTESLGSFSTGYLLPRQ